MHTPFAVGCLELTIGAAFDGAALGQVVDMTNSRDISEDCANPGLGITQYAKVPGLREAPPKQIASDSIYPYLPTLR